MTGAAPGGTTATLWAVAAFLGFLPSCTSLGRVLSYPQIDPILDVGWYTPWERVAGQGGAPLPRAPARRVALDRVVLGQAVAYARRMRSCALLVWHRGHLVLERYWCGRSRGSRFQTQSLAKPVVALLTGLAIRDGRLPSVDTPVARYLSGWADDARSSITVRHLLQMTSGLAPGPLVKVHVGTDVRGYTLAVPSRNPPGTRFDYNNMNAQILGLLLEQVYGERYARLLSRLLWRPLGAGHARVWLDVPGGTAKTYCCLLATAPDWVRVGLLLLHRGKVGGRQVVPAHWIDHMLRPSARNASFGFFTWLGGAKGARAPGWRKPFAASDTLMLSGRREQRVYVIRSHDLVIVRLGQEAGPHWEDSYLPNLMVRGLSGTHPVGRGSR